MNSSLALKIQVNAAFLFDAEPRVMDPEAHRRVLELLRIDHQYTRERNHVRIDHQDTRERNHEDEDARERNHEDPPLATRERNREDARLATRERKREALARGYTKLMDIIARRRHEIELPGTQNKKIYSLTLHRQVPKSDGTVDRRVTNTDSSTSSSSADSEDGSESLRIPGSDSGEDVGTNYVNTSVFSTLVAIKKLIRSNTIESCPICHDEFQIGDDVVGWQRCSHGHYYHRACIARWVGSGTLKRTCPNCRKPITLFELENIRFTMLLPDGTNLDDEKCRYVYHVFSGKSLGLLSYDGQIDFLHQFCERYGIDTEASNLNPTLEKHKRTLLEREKISIKLQQEKDLGSFESGKK